MASSSTPRAATTELILVSPSRSTESAERASTARKRNITPSAEQSTPCKVAVITWPGQTISDGELGRLLSDALQTQWSRATVQAFATTRLRYEPLYTGPAPVPVRHMVLSFDLLKTPSMLNNDKGVLGFLFDIFPNTLIVAMMRPFLLLGLSSLPPRPWPKSIAGLIPYFYLTDKANPMPPTPGPTQPPMSIGHSPPPKNQTIAGDLNGRDTYNWRPIFDALRQYFEEEHIDITEVIYWYSYVIVVLRNRATDPARLPKRVGRLPCGYLFEDEMGRSQAPRSRRLVDLSPGNPDVSTYNTLQPGLRVTSGYMNPTGQQFMATTSGVLVKDAVGNNFMTAAAHGFPAAGGVDVYHPSPQGREIGELVGHVGHIDVALVKLVSTETFNNVTFENYDTPTSEALKSLMPADSLRMRDPVFIDNPDTGALEGSFVTTSYTAIPSDDPSVQEQRWIETAWFYMGQEEDDTQQLPDGICGSAVMTSRDDGMHVVGSFAVCRGEDQWRVIARVRLLMSSSAGGTRWSSNDWGGN
ncbi:hypothetical protein CONLIGDRAFT_693857 [Coniochaeta ligniaria NRRL 30616]|uniref:Uncharacterized protein n=1 Tax=Coniochaeta ligniaria NRRL 30616 TaxID=1408157 RepID=A0A1J7I6I6_9PEZI|nr:hypothetical protein CONLIGDRAFT_693857 [Coniochaeta ligniaria NRRL 30616]